MAKIPEQKTAEQWLEETAPQKKLAIFKLFLGYAPGVGKTFNMLSEGIRRASRGEEVVAGLVETHAKALRSLRPDSRWCLAED
jgi:two-component system sensor histidine kinase KdpD